MIMVTPLCVVLVRIYGIKIASRRHSAKGRNAAGRAGSKRSAVTETTFSAHYYMLYRNRLCTPDPHTPPWKGDGERRVNLCRRVAT